MATARVLPSRQATAPAAATPTLDTPTLKPCSVGSTGLTNELQTRGVHQRYVAGSLELAYAQNPELRQVAPDAGNNDSPVSASV